MVLIGVGGWFAYQQIAGNDQSKVALGDKNPNTEETDEQQSADTTPNEDPTTGLSANPATSGTASNFNELPYDPTASQPSYPDPTFGSSYQDPSYSGGSSSYTYTQDPSSYGTASTASGSAATLSGTSDYQQNATQPSSLAQTGQPTDSGYQTPASTGGSSSYTYPQDPSSYGSGLSDTYSPGSNLPAAPADIPSPTTTGSNGYGSLAGGGYSNQPMSGTSNYDYNSAAGSSPVYNSGTSGQPATADPPYGPIATLQDNATLPGTSTQPAAGSNVLRQPETYGTVTQPTSSYTAQPNGSYAGQYNNAAGTTTGTQDNSYGAYQNSGYQGVGSQSIASTPESSYANNASPLPSTGNYSVTGGYSSAGNYPAAGSYAAGNQYLPSQSTTGNTGASSADTYKVQPNDNFASISKTVYGTDAYYQALTKHNSARYPDPRNLRYGDIVDTPSIEFLETNYPTLCPSRDHRLIQQQRESAMQTVGHLSNTRAYTVQNGDTLYSIAEYELGAKGRWVEIFRLNQQLIGDRPDYISPGLQLKLPADQAQPLGQQPVDTLTSRPMNTTPGGYYNR